MEQRTTEKPIWRGRVFDFCEAEIVLPNGKQTAAGVIRHPGSAAIVPVREDGSVIVIRQYRAAIRDSIWEVPAGCMDPGEDALSCAKRELREETGYSANRFQKVGEIWVAPGYSTERIHLFLATELTRAETSLDEDEFLSVHSFPFGRLLEMVDRNEIQDAMTIIAIRRAYPVWKAMVAD